MKVRYLNLMFNLLSRNLNNWCRKYSGGHQKHSGKHFFVVLIEADY